jgi:predicted ATP-binding protein involved in virulence
MNESGIKYEIDSNSNIRERLLYYYELSKLNEEKRKEKEKKNERKED